MANRRSKKSFQRQFELNSRDSMKMKLKKFIDSSPSGRLNLFDSVRDDEVENRAEEPNDKRGENGSENQAPFTQ